MLAYPGSTVASARQALQSHAGHDLFPEVQQFYAATHGGGAHADLDHDRCFSLLLQIPIKGSGEERCLALHLELPPGGNGRSRDEWLAAFSSLMCKKLPLYRKAEPSMMSDLESKLGGLAGEVGVGGGSEGGDGGRSGPGSASGADDTEGEE